MLNKCDINVFISLTQTPRKKEGKKKKEILSGASFHVFYYILYPSKEMTSS